MSEDNFWVLEVQMQERNIAKCKTRLKSLNKQLKKWEDGIKYHEKKLEETREHLEERTAVIV